MLRPRARAGDPYEFQPATLSRAGAYVYVAFRSSRLNDFPLRPCRNQRCVEIALKEFGGLSSRAIAEMCGVSDKTVEAARETCGNSAREIRVDTLGRNQPAHKDATRRPPTIAQDAQSRSRSPPSTTAMNLRIAGLWRVGAFGRAKTWARGFKAILRDPDAARGLRPARPAVPFVADFFRRNIF